MAEIVPLLKGTDYEASVVAVRMCKILTLDLRPSNDKGECMSKGHAQCTLAASQQLCAEYPQCTYK